MTRGTLAPLAATAVACAVAGVFAARDLGVPGLYYDEVIQAEPAVQFLAEDGRPSQVPGVTSTRLFGGWFPLMTQTYMGGLKSQLLIPVFAVFEPTAASLRLATLAAALLGLLLALLWTRDVLGPAVAAVAGLLVACDPGFLFTARHDWGSFALGLVCRGGGLWLVTAGWRARGGAAGLARLAAGGALLGLGVYNKIDFAVFLAAAALALALAAPGAVARGLGARRGALAGLAAAFALGAAPMLASLGGALAATRYVLREPGGHGLDWGEKLRAGLAVLDGSYFERLVLAGGRFEAMFAEPVAGGPFPAIFAACSVLLALRLARRRPLSCDRDRARAFALWTAWLTLAGIVLTPRAERIHHFENALPFPQLVVAIAAVDLWREGARRALARGLAAALVAACLASGLVLDARTAALLRETGGRGRWSDSLAGFAAELAGEEPIPVVVSLDWGFDGPLRFYARGLPQLEPIWALQRPLPAGRSWRAPGGPSHVYLLYPEEFAVFGFGGAFLTALRELPPGSYAVREHRDRRGDTAFLSVRIARPHELEYARGSFEVTLR